MALQIGGTLADWTTTQLTRFIKDIFERDPPGLIGTTTIENLTVAHQLVVADQLSFTRDPAFHKIGGNGEPAFTNSWVNWGSPYNPAGFWKDPLGIVHLRGVIKSGTVGSAAFTLPAGSRPANTELFPVFSNATIGRLEVGSDGTVTPQSPSNNAYVALDGLTFKAL